MNPNGKFTIGLQIVVMVNGEPVNKLRIIYSEGYVTQADAKAMADKHREFVHMECPSHVYDYEWQAAGFAV